jgi:flagellum-specific peptidoglycan hydrolase FlgJ
MNLRVTDLRKPKEATMTDRKAMLTVLALSLLLQGCTVRVQAPVLGNGSAPDAPAGTAPLSGPVTASLPTSPGPSDPAQSAPVPDGALASWKGGKLAPQQFFRLLAPAAIAVERQTGVPAAITLAQAALETGFGGSTIGGAKNLFGIKGRGPAGSVTAPTREVLGGRSVTVSAQFRKYDTWEESVLDHGRLLAGNRRYAAAMNARRDPEACARELERAGYATDPNYAESLIHLMREYKLVGLSNA